MLNPTNPQDITSDSFHKMTPIFEWLREEMRSELSRRKGEFYQYVPYVNHIRDNYQFLSDRQIALLAYYLPFKNKIRSSPFLQKSCIQSCIEVAVQLEIVLIKEYWNRSSRLGREAIVNHIAIGGTAHKHCQHIKVHLGPIPLKVLQNFVDGGSNRIFLEKALIPNFLPEGCKTTIILHVAEKERKLKFSSSDHLCLLGINSFI